MLDLNMEVEANIDVEFEEVEQGRCVHGLVDLGDGAGCRVQDEVVLARLADRHDLEADPLDPCEQTERVRRLVAVTRQVADARGVGAATEPDAEAQQKAA